MQEQTRQRASTSARLRFVLGAKATDIALPADVPLVDVLPAILPQFGAEWVEQGADHEGWVVQQIGKAPLDEDRTVTELDLVDGDTLFLRPRADQLATIDYDDLVDGVGEQVREHRWAWTTARTRWMFHTGAAVTLLVGLLLLLPGPGSPALQALVATGCAMALVVGGVLVARGPDDRAVAMILASAGVAYAAVAGLLLIALLDPAAEPMMLLTGMALAALIALTATLLGIPAAKYAHTGAVLFFATLALTGVTGSLAAVTAAQAVGIGLVVSLVVGVFLPSAAFRLSGLTLPALPTGPEELGDDIDPVPHRTVVDRGAATVGYATALAAGLGLAQTALLPTLIASGHGWSMILAAVIALLLLLRTRHPVGTVPRWALLVPAAVAGLGIVVHIGLEHTDATRLLLAFLPVFALAAALLLGGRRLPGRKLRPYWGRVVEILESITAVATVPLLLQVLGVFATMRGLAG